MNEVRETAGERSHKPVYLVGNRDTAETGGYNDTEGVSKRVSSSTSETTEARRWGGECIPPIGIDVKGGTPRRCLKHEHACALTLSTQTLTA